MCAVQNRYNNRWFFNGLYIMGAHTHQLKIYIFNCKYWCLHCLHPTNLSRTYTYLYSDIKFRMNITRSYKTSLEFFSTLCLICIALCPATLTLAIEYGFNVSYPVIRHEIDAAERSHGILSNHQMFYEDLVKVCHKISGKERQNKAYDKQPPMKHCQPLNMKIRGINLPFLGA